MIRDFSPTDIDRVLEIWLNGNKEAHSFIPTAYWEENAPLVKQLLLEAEILIYEDRDGIQGFAGLQDNYLAGLFIDRAHRSQGIGKQLLSEAKKRHDQLALHVYEENARAIAFYIREGFTITKTDVDEDTGRNEHTMTWSASEG